MADFGAWVAMTFDSRMRVEAEGPEVWMVWRSERDSIGRFLSPAKARELAKALLAAADAAEAAEVAA